MRKAACLHAIRETSGPETRVSLGVALRVCTGNVGLKHKILQWTIILSKSVELD